MRINFSKDNSTRLTKLGNILPKRHRALDTRHPTDFSTASADLIASPCQGQEVARCNSADLMLKLHSDKESEPRPARRRRTPPLALASLALGIGLPVGYFIREREHSSGHRAPNRNAADKLAVPYIAVLAVPSTVTPHQDYIPASVISWIQSAGAVAVPIPSGVYWNTTTSNWVTEQSDVWTTAEYISTFRAVNALLLPGGDPWPQISSDALRLLYSLALEANSRGDYFPIWGTCAGMETLIAYAANACQSRVRDGNIPTGTCGADGPITRGFDAKNMSIPLGLNASSGTSSLFSSASPALVHALRSENITFNYHSGGASPSMVAKFSNLRAMYKILSTNRDRLGREYVSTIEGVSLPFFGVQWHPEKVMYEWGVRDGHAYEAINHSAHAMAASKYMADFFVGEARKSQHSYSSLLAGFSASIYTRSPSVYNPEHPMYTGVYHLDWSRSR